MYQMKNIASQVDGFCMEHVMAFEDLIWNAKSAPFHSVKNLKNLIHLRNELVKQNKYVLSKYVMVTLWISYNIFLNKRNFPGPLGGKPWLKIGSINGPQLPPSHPYPQPTTNLEMQQAYKVIIINQSMHTTFERSKGLGLLN